jgi:hypothetical protein
MTGPFLSVADAKRNGSSRGENAGFPLSPRAERLAIIAAFSLPKEPPEPP